METTNHNNSELRYTDLGWLILFSLLTGTALYIIGSVIKNNQGAYLILFILLYVLFPGWMYLGILDTDSLKEKGWRFLKAGYFGFFLLIIQYYILNYLHLLSFIKITPLLIGLTGLLFFYVKKNNFKSLFPSLIEKSPKISSIQILHSFLPFFLILVLFMTYSYLVLIKTTPSADQSIFLDYYYHMGNIGTLTKGGDLTDLRIAGMPLRYHYFMELFYAILRRIHRVEIYNCAVRYPIILIPLIACSSIYLVFKTVIRSNTICALFTGTLLFFSDLSPNYTHLTSHTGTNINSVGMALPALILLVYSLAQTFQEKKLKIGHLILILGFSICLAGLKGPFCMAAVGGSILTVIIMFLKTKRISPVFTAAVITALIGFAIIWYFLLRTAVNTENVESGATLFGVIRQGIPIPAPFTNLIAENSPKALLLIPYCIIYAFGGFGVLFILAAINCIVHIRKKQSFYVLYLVIVSLVSLLCNYFMAVGRNRVYFLMSAAPFAAAAGAAWLKWFWENNRIHINLKALLIFLCSLITSVAIIHSVKSPLTYRGSGTVSRDDAAAVKWIRDNISDDSILALNDHNENSKFFYYSSNTEKQFYLETIHYSMNSGKTSAELQEQLQANDRLFAPTFINRAEEARRLGIDYLVQIDYSGEFPTDLSKDLTLCFDSDTVRIYQV